MADEHIIPFALGGDRILPEASCQKCERITGGFEQRALRGILRGARITLGYPTRKGHPETLPLYAHSDGAVFKIEIPSDDYPALIHIAVPAWFPMALTNFDLDPNGRWYIWGGPLNEAGSELVGDRSESSPPPKIEMTDAPPERIYHSEGIILPSLDIRSFFRMVAKIAHAFAVAEFGLGSFKPYLLTIIDGTEIDDIGLYAGGTREPDLVPRHEAASHIVQPHFEHFFDGTTILIISIRLFSSLGAPPIFLAVGELNLYNLTPQRLKHVLEEPLSRTFERIPSPDLKEPPKSDHP